MLAEVLVVLVLSAIVVGTLLAALIALVRGLQPPRVALLGEALPIAPSFGAFPSAVRLHQTLTDRVAAARAVYVLGGRHVSIPADSAPAQVRPLQAQALPAIPDFGPGLPLDAATFYDRYAAALGAQEPAGSADDFTIVVIGPHGATLAVTCLVQVRRTDTAVADGSERTDFIVREVRLWDVDDGTLRYAFAEKSLQANGLFVGAVHTWLRYQANAAREEGPACVVFPDPWVYGGGRGRADDLPPFSRFSYFFAVSP